MNGDRPDLASYLPAIYHEAAREPESALGALLSVAEDLFGAIEESMATQDRYFDPITAPSDERADFVSWLASWVDLEIDQNWTERERRELVGAAVGLYESRGTAHGLIAVLRSFFGIEVSIEEWRWPEGMVIGRKSTLGTDSKLYETADVGRCFQVRWSPSEPPDESLVRRIRRAIDMERPAHSSCFFVIDQGEEETRLLPEMVLGLDSTIGNFYIG